MRDPSARLGDLLCALAAGCAALVLYVATLQPDIGGPEDTTKFQLVGYVLGTAHPPGYPFYVVASHLFAKLLPIGTVGFAPTRFRSAAGGLRLRSSLPGRRRCAAVAAALALATGAAVWRNAVVAEGYSLAAAMNALTIGLLLAWGERSRAGLLIAATAAFALGAGNHLTIVGLVPAAVCYVLLRNRRALTPRVLAMVTIVVLLGIAQYGFIWLRTSQRALYLESRASSLSELWDVMMARRFADDRFAFGPSEIVTTRVPAVAAVVGDELGAAGVLLAGLGAIAALRARSSAAALVAGAALGVFAMVANLSGDLQGFITPLTVLVWPFAALGIDAIVIALELVPAAGPALGSVVIAAALGLPATRLMANYENADRSRQTEDGRFLRAMYARLPNNANRGENYWLNMTLFTSFTVKRARGIGNLIRTMACAICAAGAPGLR